MPRAAAIKPFDAIIASPGIGRRNAVFEKQTPLIPGVINLKAKLYEENCGGQLHM
jgi:hypothetical protein